jgi:hypothetical protein
MIQERTGNINRVANTQKENEMRINVDPDTSSSGFGYAAAGKYRLRIIKVEQATAKFPYLKWTFEFADPNVKPEGGEAKKVGSIFENTTLKKGENSQFRLKQLCDSIGVTWGDFDTDDLIGREFEAEVDLKDYQGTISNEVKKYIPIKK